MTEYFRIQGLHLIDFDRQTVSATPPIYNLSTNVIIRELSAPMSRPEIRVELPNLPVGIRGHALNRGLSKVVFTFDIKAESDAAVEQALHDLKETLNEGALFIESEGQRGTRALLRYQMNNASASSYKTIYCGLLREAGGRHVLGPEVKVQYLVGLQLTLYMEPMWRPSAAIALGPNEVYCPGFEEDGNADGLADNWNLIFGTLPTCTMEATIVLQGFYSQKVVTRAIVGDGIRSDVFVPPAGTTQCIGYAWIARPAAGSNIIVDVYDETAAAVRGSALYDTAGWDTELAKDGVTTFKRVEVPVAAGIVAGNNHRIRIYNTQATITTLYADKSFLKWNTTTVPDEWCDHFYVFNHYDTTTGAAHEGHQNYFDVCDLKGTDEARLQVLVQADQIADLDHYGDLVVARRSNWDEPSLVANIVSDVHWLELENATTLTNWAALGGLARCSGGDCVSNAANVAGSAQFRFLQTAIGATFDSACMLGRFDVFAMVYTDDQVNTQYRLSYTNYYGLLTFYNRWVKQPDDSLWQMIYLGEVNFDAFIRAGLEPHDLYLTVEYEKDAADTVRGDCLWLLSKKEPETRLQITDGMPLGSTGWWGYDRTEDFDYEECEYRLGVLISAAGELCLQGDQMTLTPKKIVGQRLYMSCESIDVSPTPDERAWEAHGAATPLRLEVEMAYMPQYQTPLD